MKASALTARVVEPYAEALLSLAESQNLVAPFGEQMQALLELLNNSQELQDFFANPLVSGEAKKAVVKRITGEDTNPYLVNFLLLLVDRRRIMFVQAIAAKYLELLRKLNNIVLAEVTSATELDEGQKNAISEKVKQLSGAAGVELKTSIDPDLIGGVIIQVGSQIFDASLRGQLRRIGLSLT